MKILNKEFLLIINKKIFLISYFLFLISYYTTLISSKDTFGLEILTKVFLGIPLLFISIFFFIIYFFNLITRANVYLCLKFKFIFLGFLISYGLIQIFMILGISLDKSDIYPSFSLDLALFLALPLILHISYLIYCKEYNYIIPGIKENKLSSIFIIIMIFSLLNYLFMGLFS